MNGNYYSVGYAAQLLGVYPQRILALDVEPTYTVDGIAHFDEAALCTIMDRLKRAGWQSPVLTTPAPTPEIRS